MTAMKPPTSSALALLTLAEIKAVTERFDRGEANLFDAIDEIVEAVESYRATLRGRLAA